MKKTVVKSEFRALGTDIKIQIVVPENEKLAKNDVAKAEKIFFQEQKIFDRFDPVSEISNLNNKLNHFNNASSDMLYLAGRALYYNKISDGLYDPRIIEILEKIGYDHDFRKKDFSKTEISSEFQPLKDSLSKDLKIKDNKIYFRRRMDFSGIAKGYITDLAAKFLKNTGWENFLIDSGGDIFAAGKNKSGSVWRIAIEGMPENKLILFVSGKGIATSGISRKKWEIRGKKFHHLVNPKNPNHFSYEIRTVSVIAENTENADSRAKVLVLLGKKKGMEFAEKNKIAAILLDYKGNIFISSEAKRYILNN